MVSGEENKKILILRTVLVSRGSCFFPVQRILEIWSYRKWWFLVMPEVDEDDAPDEAE